MANIPSESDPQTHDQLSTKTTITSRINLAFFENAVPVLRELVVINDSDETWEDLTITIESDRPFFKRKPWVLDRIGPKRAHHVVGLDLALDGLQLRRLTEAVRLTTKFTLRQGDRVLSKEEKSVELLAHNEWGGIVEMPEILAAFVQPNDPTVAGLLKKAGNILDRNTRSNAIGGYQSGSGRAWQLAEALWHAVISLDLTYAMPPASFEVAGQKIRSPSQIQEVGLATCLDSTLLFCSMLEQAGLNAVIILCKGHALAGFWLHDETFSDVAMDDSATLRNRIELDDLVIFETTLVTHGPGIKFSQAIEVGKRRIAEGSDGDDFQVLIDVKRARNQNIKPLATEWDRQNRPVSQEVDKPKFPQWEEAPFLISEQEDRPDVEEASDRLQQWRRKLLDLSLRNRMINFKPGRRTLQLFVPDSPRLENLLSNGKSFEIRAFRNSTKERDQRSREIQRERGQINLDGKEAFEEMIRFRLYADATQGETDKILLELFRSGRNALQEGGANILFLALGFLAYKRMDDRENRTLLAPLILLPIALKRKNAGAAFRLARSGEEPFFNHTLIELLKQDFDLKLPITPDGLPSNEQGLDILTVWHTVARAVKGIPGWELKKDVYLGSFSFSKLLMWKDLTDHLDQLKQSSVVRHLIENPHQPFPSKHASISPKSLDRDLRPQDMLTPLQADSSQLTAIAMAAKGKSFVLEGPPGTGKSQTIVNIIADGLGQGKKILFVSEKMAALEVVSRRLREIGLGPYCLDLHSNKVSKLAVMAKLKTAWDGCGDGDADLWEERSRQLGGIRDRLNLYVQNLHRRYPNGWTPYQAMGILISDKTGLRLNLPWQRSDIHDQKEWAALKETVKRLAIHAGVRETLSAASLSWIEQADYSRKWQNETEATAAKCCVELTRLKTTIRDFLSQLELPPFPLSLKHLDALFKLAELLKSLPEKPWSFMLEPKAEEIFSDLVKGCVLLREMKSKSEALKPLLGEEEQRQLRFGLANLIRHGELKAQFGVSSAEELSALNPSQLERAWSGAQQAMIGLKWFKTNRVQKSIEKVLGPKPRPEIPDIIRELKQFHQLEEDLNNNPGLTRLNLWQGVRTSISHADLYLRFHDLAGAESKGVDWNLETTMADTIPEGDTELKALAVRLQELAEIRAEFVPLEWMTGETKGFWRGKATDLTSVQTLLDFHRRWKKVKNLLTPKLSLAEETNLAFRRVLRCFFPPLEAFDALLEVGEQFRHSKQQFDQTWNRLLTLAGRPLTDRGPGDNLQLSEIEQRCQQLGRNIGSLKRWCAWREIQAEARRAGLTSLVTKIDAEEISKNDIEPVFTVSYARWWLDKVVDEDEVLARFNSAEHSRLIQDFQSLDDAWQAGVTGIISARIQHNRPQKDQWAEDQWGLLRRQMSKKRGLLPVRELMNQVPHAMSSLVPCLLMSPLSVAQYLSATHYRFDLIIFDEASQIPVWDAVGAISRGKQVVMVGDPKQLPPTNFFHRTDDEWNEDEPETDLESILDECIAAGLPVHRLKWHYRSRHESLITFSNFKYYEGKLITFPSNDTQQNAIEFHRISDGVYLKGKGRSNPIEARRLVDHLIRHLNEIQAENCTPPTFGIVTFNQQQQDLIENLLDEKRRKHPALEPFFSDNSQEPLFVKNLENVQGDERDIIYFSTTFGPDAQGKLSLNFGALNRSGGERRLNVAITRARQKLHVFSSLEADQINLSRTNAIGVRDLKHFLEFADRGPRALAEAVSGSVGNYESPFEEAVARALSAKGWITEPQIGVSQFRIDLGIRHPHKPGRFLAGIECDGATYHRSATARDRDKLRQQVLEGVGWTILRVWSTDWWQDKRECAEALHRQLEALLAREKTNEDAPSAAVARNPTRSGKDE